VSKSVKKKSTPKTVKPAVKSKPAALRTSKKKVVKKKTVSKKTTAKRSAAPPKAKAAAKKKIVKKKVTKKKVTKKKVVKKSPPKKVVKKKTVTKKTAKKKIATKKKTVAKKAAASKKTTTKKPTARKVSKTTRSISSAKKTDKKKPVAVTVVTKKTKGPGKTVKKIVKPKPQKIKRPRVPYAALSEPAPPAYNPRDHTPLTQAQLRKIKTELTRKDMNHFRRDLLERRAEIVGDVQGLEAARTGSDNSHMPLHMADIGSDNYEQEFTLGLMESERKTIIEIDGALQRIADKIYGVCIESGVLISRPRLDAKPWAKYCIEVARERERRGL